MTQIALQVALLLVCAEVLKLHLLAHQLITKSAFFCRDSDRTSSRTADVLRNVAELELIEAPTLSFVPPKSYNNRPQLRGTLLCFCLSQCSQ